MSKTCLECSGAIENPKPAGGGKEKKFCSTAHQQRYHGRKRYQAAKEKRAAKPARTAICSHCGLNFTDLSRKPRVVCDDCYLDATHQTISQEYLEFAKRPTACATCAYATPSSQSDSGYMCTIDRALQCKPWRGGEPPLKKAEVA